MRPVTIELQGFGAFRERTVVDLADAELFAIVGATGHGKSTLIDAICFALYGSVPRYGGRDIAPVICAFTTAACPSTCGASLSCTSMRRSWAREREAGMAVSFGGVMAGIKPDLPRCAKTASARRYATFERLRRLASHGAGTSFRRASTIGCERR